MDGISSSLAYGFISGGNEFPDFGAGGRFFATAFVGSMTRKEVHLAETATIPGHVIFSNKDPDTRNEESLMSIRCRPDFFHVVDGFFIQRPVGEGVRIRQGFHSADRG